MRDVCLLLRMVSLYYGTEYRGDEIFIARLPRCAGAVLCMPLCSLLFLQAAGAFVAILFCLTLNALLLLVPEYHMMDMNIISLITISLLMVSNTLFAHVGGASQGKYTLRCN